MVYKCSGDLNQRKIDDSTEFEVKHRGVWKKFIPAQERRNFLTSMHNFKMIALSKEMNIIWPNISADIFYLVGGTSDALSVLVESVIAHCITKSMIRRVDKDGYIASSYERGDYILYLLLLYFLHIHSFIMMLN